MGIEDQVDEMSKEVGSGGWFKVKEGDNKIRILTDTEILVSRYGFGACYSGCGYCSKEALEKAKDSKGNPATLTKKFVAWIWDYDDEQLKLYSMPFVISQQIVDLKRDETNGYDFDQFPMPYDVTIHAKNAGTKDVKYTVKPARENTDVPEDVLKQLEAESTVEQVVNAVKDKARREHEGEKPIEYPDEEIDPDDIPFEGGKAE